MSFLENPLGSKELDEDDKNGSYVKSSKLIVDDDKEIYEEKESDEETELFDSVCCICDDGGELLGCKGRCMRSFHATPDAGIDSHCKSLGLSDAQVNAIQNFFCLNCQRKRYQCFACGKLGSSDKSSGAEIDFNFEQRDWMSVRPKELPTGSRLVRNEIITSIMTQKRELEDGVAIR